jgi:triosephosphate isomerase
VAAAASGRRPIIAANWKMHKTHLESIKSAQQLSYLIDTKTTDQVEVVICSPFTSLRSLQTLFDADRLPYALGAQDVHWEDKGALTGEISPRMLAALNCRYVIVGHSERRQFFGETDDRVAKKVKAVFAAGMVPILCVGESLEERDSGRTEDKVVTQVKTALGGLSETLVAQLVMAYEPIWAIGTGRNADPQDAGEVISLIRNTIGTMFSSPPAGSVRVQYGGSVKPGNIREFMAHPEIDGALVGGASLDPEEFALIVRYRG